MSMTFWEKFLTDYGKNPTESPLFTTWKKDLPVPFIIQLIDIIYKPPTAEIQLHAAAMLKKLVSIDALSLQMDQESSNKIKEAALALMAEDAEDSLRRCGIKMTRLLLAISLVKPDDWPEFKEFFETGFADKEVVKSIGALIAKLSPLDQFYLEYAAPFLNRYPRLFFKIVVHHLRVGEDIWPFLLTTAAWNHCSSPRKWMLMAGAAIMSPFFKKTHFSTYNRIRVGESLITIVRIMNFNNMCFTQPMLRSLNEAAASLFQGGKDERGCAMRISMAVITISRQLIIS